MQESNRGRVLVAALALSISAGSASFVAWKSNEGFTAEPVIPTQGDVPTIGHGSTHYEDGTPVRMTDAPITPQRAEVLAMNLMQKDAQRLADSVPGAQLYQAEFDEYLDFTGQYGFRNWFNSSMRKDVIAGRYEQACKDLLNWRFAADYDCSTRVNGKPNKRCWGVWTRQLRRYHNCMEAQA